MATGISPGDVGHRTAIMAERITRRDLVAGSLPPAASGMLALGAAAGAQEQPPAKSPGGTAGMPVGRIGKLSVSRLLPGGNLLTHSPHSRDLKYVYDLTAHYNTEAKILETLATAEAHGVNTLAIHTVPHALATLRKHRKRGGKIQWIVCPTAPIQPGLAACRPGRPAMLRRPVRYTPGRSQRLTLPIAFKETRHDQAERPVYSVRPAQCQVPGAQGASGRQDAEPRPVGGRGGAL